jgi:glycosyltransferase involved in cell wall biosynthesis
MKILLISHEYPPHGGGAGVGLRHFADALVEMGMEVRVLACGVETAVAEENGVTVHRMAIYAGKKGASAWKSWTTFLLKTPFHLRKISREWKPDVINAHFLFPAGWLATRCAREIPVVITLVGGEIYDPTRKLSATDNALMRALGRKTCRRARALVGGSHDITRRAKALFPGLDVETIHWGIPPTPRMVLAEDEPTFPPGSLILITVCRLIPRKRLDVIVDAMARVGDSRLKWVVIGEGSERARLESRVIRENLGEQVYFLGRVSDQRKAAWLNHADVMCLPSEHEGFGLVFLEAMSVGTPVITTSTGGQTDIVRHGQEGLLLPTPDSAFLASELRSLLNNPATLADWGTASQSRYEQYFSSTEMARKYLQIFQKLVSEN